MIDIEAIIKKISTSLDGGYTLTFDVAETAQDQVKELIGLRNELLILTIHAQACKDEIK